MKRKANKTNLDVFICHAGEEKDLLAEPLADILKEHGLDVFYDKYSILFTDENSKSIHDGLNRSLVGFPIFSQAFFSKYWTIFELGVLDHKKFEGHSALFPGYYNISRQRVSKKLAFLGNIKGIDIHPNNLHEVADRIIEIVSIQKLKIHQKRTKVTLFSALAFIFLVLGFLFYQLRIANKTDRHLTLNFHNDYFDSVQDKYRILLLPFQPLEKCQYKKTNIEHTIITRLRDLDSRDNLNLDIKFDTIDCVKSHEDAEKLGKMVKANLVIWGDLYEHCLNSNEANLKYVIISSKNQTGTSTFFGQSGIEDFISLSEISNGKLQYNIDYIVYWIASSRDFFKKDYSRALHNFKFLEKNYPGDFYLTASIALCYYMLDSTNKAKAYIEKVLDNDSGFVEIRLLYADILENKLNDIISASKQYMMAYKIDPNNSNVQGHYAFLLENKFKDIKGAREHYEIALKLNPNNATIQTQYAFFLEMNYNDLELADEHYKKALEIDPDLYLLQLYYATHLVQYNRDLLSARDHYEKAIELNPKFAYAHVVYASFLYRNFYDISNSRFQLEKAISIDPNYALAHFFLSHILKVDFNDPLNSQIQFKIALQLDPSLKNRKDDFIGHIVKLIDPNLTHLKRYH